jgi:succinate-semialdehyde dehydrogenase / glutarate-semialdehyde dehydrogenase
MTTVAADSAARLGHRMSAPRVRNGMTPGVDVGPLIDQAACAKVQHLLQDAVERSATVVAGGGFPDGPGFFVEPTVLTEVDPGAEPNRTEIFGPLAAIQTFSDLDDVITRANATDWGLVAYVITQDVDVALTISERLEVGMVGLNTGIVFTPSAPFGGIKQSGLGREGGRVGIDEYSIDEYLESKYISIPVRR